MVSYSTFNPGSLCDVSPRLANVTWGPVFLFYFCNKVEVEVHIMEIINLDHQEVVTVVHNSDWHCGVS